MNGINRIENEIILHGRRNNQAWFAPNIAVVPRAGEGGCPEIMVTAQQLTGNDIGPGHYLKTADMGKKWTPPMENQGLFKIPLEDDVFERPGLFWIYHKKSNKLLGIGNTYFTRDRGDETGFKKEEYVFGRKRSQIHAVWNDEKNDPEPWQRMNLPEKLNWMGGVSIFAYQNHECEDGSLLLPISHRPGDKPPCVGTIRCEFDGKKVVIIDSGKTVGTGTSPGACEPSLVEFVGRYFLTIRSASGGDFRMYHAASEDGLNWEDFSPWCWDDGTEIETENTQQHWLRRANSLYLVYTRKSELSNGVFRSRAPLWMAKVDIKTLRLIRESEVVIFPEKRARMCNFCVANITSKESWIVTGEWLEGMFPDKKKGMRFYVENSTINYIQYVGDLLLARIYWKD